jgi:hypothetical protein
MFQMEMGEETPNKIPNEIVGLSLHGGGARHGNHRAPIEFGSFGGDQRSPQNVQQENSHLDAMSAGLKDMLGVRRE